MIPYIRAGEPIPIGISKHRTGRYLKFPVLTRIRKDYSIDQERFVFGKWRFEILFKTGTNRVSLSWGWNLIQECRF